jgi:hypothetical protein
MGFAVFPVKEGQKKPPLIKNFGADATTDPKQAEEWWTRWPNANLAIVPGRSSMVAVDVDPGADVEGLDLPPTGIVARTPRGGEHRFYKLGDEEYIGPSVGKVATNVDLRSSNSYVLVEPSVNETGEYYWERIEQYATYRPEWLVEKAMENVRVKADNRDDWTIEADLEHNIERAVHWLENDAKVSVRGEGGDNTCYATAAHLRSLGISQGKAVELMFDYWNKREGNEWTWEGIERKAQNAYAYASDPPGNYTTEYKDAEVKGLFQNVKDRLEEEEEDEEFDEDDYQVGRYRFVTVRGLRRMEPPAWLVKDFIPDDAYVILYGSRGTFKTFMALDIALSLVHRKDSWPAPGYWAGGISGTPGPALYAAGEGWRNLQKRVDAWQDYYLKRRIDSQMLTVNPVPGIVATDANSKEFEDFIVGAKKKHDKYSLTVLDTIGRAMQGVNENAQDNASLFTRVVDEIKLQLGGAVVAIHHAGHQHDHARGSSVFEADADTIVKLERFQKNYVVSARMTKQKDSEEWEDPKVYALEKVEVGYELSSLVTRQPTEQEKLQNPADPIGWMNDLILEKLDEWGGKKITQTEMLNFLTAKTGLAMENLRPKLQELIHSDQPAAQRYRDGGWQS